MFGQLIKIVKRAFDFRCQTLNLVVSSRLASAYPMPQAPWEATVFRLQGAGLVLCSGSARPLQSAGDGMVSGTPAEK